MVKGAEGVPREATEAGAVKTGAGERTCGCTRQNAGWNLRCPLWCRSCLCCLLCPGRTLGTWDPPGTR
jgi:hypothetical protein